MATISIPSGAFDHVIVGDMETSHTHSLSLSHTHISLSEAGTGTCCMHTHNGLLGMCMWLVDAVINSLVVTLKQQKT